MTAVALHWLFVVDCGMVVVLQDVSRLEIVPKTVQCAYLYNNNKCSLMVKHLSYGDCLEVRGEIIRTVLCCIVY